MSKLTSDQELFWITEKQKRLYMKQGMTKQQALEKVRDNLASKLPEAYLVGIEDGHICIRHAQNESANMGAVLSKAFGGSAHALKALENIKKGFTNAMGNEEVSPDGGRSVDGAE